MLQTVTVPAFAAENATENVEVATNDASTEEESTFNLIKADVQIDDEFKSILQVKRMRSTRITKRFLL